MTATREVSEYWDVLKWRFEELRRAGYDVPQALTLAESESVDLHQACEMLESGCPPERAVAILL